MPSANDAATALAAHAGGGSVPAVRRADEREGARARDARHALREPARARPAGSRLERARRRRRCCARPLRVPVHPHVVDDADGRRSRAGGRESTDDLLGELPGSSAPRPGTRAGRLVAGRVVRRGRRADHGGGARRPAPRTQRERRSRRPARVGPRAVPAGHGRRRGTGLRAGREVGLGRGRRSGSSPRARVRPVLRVGAPLVERVVAAAARRCRCARGQRLGEVRVYDGRRLVARVAARRRSAVAAPGAAAKVGVVPPRRTIHHLVGLVLVTRAAGSA